MPAEKKELLTFDMDDTLIHSDKAHILAFNRALQELGFRKKKQWDIQKHFGKPRVEVAKILLPKSTPVLQKKFILLHDKYLRTSVKGNVTRIKGVLSAVKKLKKHYKLAVLSNCKHKNIQLLLNTAHLDSNLFDLLLGGDEVLHGKPHPDEICKAKRLMRQKPLYHIGDSPYDLRAAKRAGVKSIGVLTGFFTHAQLKKENPTLIARSVAELPYLLMKKSNL
jgi:phosphoglycolate phosphatase-like HAD superfamily hydrolase